MSGKPSVNAWLPQHLYVNYNAMTTVHRKLPSLAGIIEGGTFIGQLKQEI